MKSKHRVFCFAFAFCCNGWTSWRRRRSIRRKRNVHKPRWRSHSLYKYTVLPLALEHCPVRVHTYTATFTETINPVATVYGTVGEFTRSFAPWPSTTACTGVLVTIGESDEPLSIGDLDTSLPRTFTSGS
ncbi:hypothetical protein PR002_g28746 [Phytophthora rubi]|uniref:Uncharacterized protein n=1 Tax=Phytophthora rubi TaxID=129364 RepID=A0A6A3H689_9STRA|nr:hypothetical protein PR002_g28746 [Phytophthora rubi]